MKIGMLFPGYGTQFVGMGKELYDESRTMQEYFEEASNCLDRNFVKLCFASSDAELSRMENAYTSLFLVSSSLAAVLKEEGIIPALIAGYNTGEYAAIHAGNGISLPDGLYLLSKYAGLYQQFLDAMHVKALQLSGASINTVRELCAQASSKNATAYVAFCNGPQDYIVTGDSPALEKLVELPEAQLAELDAVDIEVGLHSPLMDPVVANIKMYMEKVDFKELIYPLVTNADGAVVTQPDDVKTASLKQMHSPVLWTNVMQAFVESDLLVEVGPGSYLSQIAKIMYPDKPCISFNKKSDIAEIKNCIDHHLLRDAEIKE